MSLTDALAALTDAEPEIPLLKAEVQGRTSPASQGGEDTEDFKRNSISKKTCKCH